MPDVRIEPSWKTALSDEFSKEYWRNLTDFVRAEYATKTVYPPAQQIFRAFDMCPLSQVKVVIVGQDPYHGKNQANGLSFAVQAGIPLPPSLKNIYKEIHDDLGITPQSNGDLSRWAKQGVLMLNSVLTVLAGQPASHKAKGWEAFTDGVLRTLTQEREHVVYLLWGKYAQEKGAIINRTKNLVLTSGHPSPYSAHLFFGNRHFSRANFYLEQYGIEPVDWS